MYPIDLFIAFLATTSAFAIIPGPAMFYATAQTMARGRRAGFLASAGIHLGGYVHIIAAATGLTILFQAIPLLYLIVKGAGAAYLLYLGLSLIVSRAETAPVSTEFARISGRRAFLQSITVEALNPKTALFFLAFLPQFVDPTIAAPVWLQLGLLGTLVNLIFSLADIVCVLLAGAIVARVQSSLSLQTTVRRIGGAILVSLGLNLFFQRS